MTEISNLREETQKNIRGLILSSPVGLTFRELKSDYELFIGVPIPYRQLGYNALEDFLNDIPDTVRTSYEKGVLVLRAPSDPSTQHIERLVSRQKIPNKKKWAVLRKPPQRRTTYRPRPVVPGYLQHQIRQLFMAYPDGFPITYFETCFARRFGYQLDYKKLHFDTLSELLGSIPSVVKFVSFNTGEVRVLPAIQNDYNKSKTWARNQESNRSASALEPLPALEVAPLLPRPTQPDNLSKKGDNLGSPDQIDKDLSNSSYGSTDFIFNDDSDIPAQLQQEIRRVLEKKPRGIWASQLLFAYKSEFKKELPYKEHGFHSVVEFLSVLPKDLVIIQRPDKKGDWLLVDARHKKAAPELEDETPTETTNKETIDPKNDKNFCESVRQVLHMHPEGVFMHEFPNKYMEMTGLAIDDQVLYCGSLENLCIKLTEHDILQIAYKGDGQLKLHAVKTDLTRKFDKLLEVYQPHTVSKDEMVTEDDRIPADAIGPGTFYTKLTLPDLTDYIEIYVSNIVSPGVFWVQFREKNNTLALDRLMDALEFYQTAGGSQYKLPENLLAVGQVVAVVFPEDGNWHRGIITGIRTIDLVDVYYVDYGNTCSVHKKTLRLLRTRYLKLPAQAVQARLANINPVHENWTEEAKMEMLRICSRKPMIGLVTSSKNQVLSMCLTDTTSDVDVHVNDHLVQERLAVFAPDELEMSPMSPPSMLEFEPIPFKNPESTPEIPDTALLYGIPSQRDGSVGQSVGMETFKTESEGHPSSEGACQRFIRLYELTPDVCIHVINFDKEAWVLSAEISALFWAGDILRSMLQTKRFLVKKLVLSKTEYPLLFQELMYYGVKSVTNDKAYITIYALKSLPDILTAFSHPNPNLKAAVGEVLQEFDPEDLYWLGDNSSMAADIQRELEEKELGLDELKLALQALQFKRKRVLQSLLSERGSESIYVNQLAEVEVQIQKAKELMEEVERELGLEAAITDTFPSQGKQIPVVSSPEKIVNRVAPLIVNQVPPRTEAKSYNPNIDPSLCTSQAASFSVLMQQQQQMLQQMMKSQSTSSGIDPNMFNFMFPMMQNPMMQTPVMQNPMMQHMPALGRGHPASLHPRSQSDAMPDLMPSEQFPVSAADQRTSSGPSMSLPSQQANMPNIPPMMMPNLQSLLSSVPLQSCVQPNPRLATPSNTQSLASLLSRPSLHSSNVGNLMGMSNNPAAQIHPQMSLLPELLPLLENFNMEQRDTSGN